MNIPQTGAARRCGPNWLPVKIPEWRSHQTCVDHDIAYEAGGSRRDRALADRHLLEGMLRDAATRPRHQQPWYRLQAWHYYAWVRALGWLSWGSK